ncbi:MAG: Fic family protein [Kiritimatiellae bacterium]|nr:Fic family protein [Kiritimatiellia bacterium]
MERRIPFQSKCLPHEARLRQWRAEGASWHDLAARLKAEHGLSVSRGAVRSFLLRAERRRPTLFFERIPEERRTGVLKQIAALWTHDSNTIEGNTLSLGDTIKILEYGITISGKSIREHEEVYGHRRAIDLVYDAAKRGSFSRDDLFALHKAVMPAVAIDWEKPVGAWKQEPNGTLGEVDGRPEFLEYADPAFVPELMTRWLADFNEALARPIRAVDALEAYAAAHVSFVSIHPFFDGNGRLARLLANLPVLRAGEPPVVVDAARRAEYIDILWEYRRTAGALVPSAGALVRRNAAFRRFVDFLRPDWDRVREMCLGSGR